MFYATVGKRSVFLQFETLALNYMDMSQDVRNKIYKLRKEIFVDGKGWEIHSYSGGDMEFDEYDNCEAYYIIIFSNDEVAGCVRLRPSTSPTLMTGPFRSLKNMIVHGKGDDRSTWEASRFFVTPRRAVYEEQGGGDKRAYALFLSMIEFGIVNGFKYYEVVVDPAMERFLRLGGWAMKIVNSSFGSLNNRVYYGLLPCDEKAFDEVMASAEKQSRASAIMEIS